MSGSMGWRRVMRAVGVAALATALAAGLIAGGAPAGAAGSAPVGDGAGPTVTVSPAGPYDDGHPVTVAGEGHEPGASLLVAQCATEDLSSCAEPIAGVQLPSNLRAVQVAGDGTFSVRLGLRRSIPHAGQASQPCAAPGCAIRVGPVGGPAPVSVPIAMTLEGAYQWPTASLRPRWPDGGLIDGVPVEMEGEGYSPWLGGLSRVLGPSAATEVCRVVAEGDPDPDADCVDAASLGFDDLINRSVAVDESGALAGQPLGTTALVDRHLLLPDGPWDCAVGGCTVALSQDGNPRSERVPIPWAPEHAPWPSTRDLLRALYVGLLDRQPFDHELAIVAPLVEARALTAVDAAIDLAAGADLTIGEVTRQYVAFFGRRPDTPGLRFWVARMRSGASTTQSLWRSFGGVAEFRATYAGLTTAQIVDRAYQRTLGRAPDAEGRAFWIDRIRRGLPLASAVGLIARSTEFRQREAGHATITTLTFGIGGRAAPSTAQWGSDPKIVARDLIATATPGT